MIHPFTKAPTVTASTGPAAPPEIRLENDERLKEILALSPPQRQAQAHPESSPSSSPPRPIAEEERVLPVGSAANVAQSLRQQMSPVAEWLPPNPLNDPEMLASMSAAELMSRLGAPESNNDNDFLVTKFALSSMATTGGGRAQTAPNMRFKVPDDVDFEEVRSGATIQYFR